MDLEDFARRGLAAQRAVDVFTRRSSERLANRLEHLVADPTTHEADVRFATASLYLALVDELTARGDTAALARLARALIEQARAV